MCVKNAMQLSLKGDTFQALKEDFDNVLARTIGNMEMKGAEDATITLKLSIQLEKSNIGSLGESEEITKPSFNHVISSVMQVKDKKTGALTGDYELVWDHEEKRYVMRRLADRQISLFDDEVDAGEGEYYVEETPSRPMLIEAGKKEVDPFYPAMPASVTPWGWISMFIGKEMFVVESKGNYTVRTLNNDIILTSSVDSLSDFQCPKETLERHVGHKLSCVKTEAEDLGASILIVCEDCNETIFEYSMWQKTGTTDNFEFGGSEGEVVMEYDDPEEN